MDKTKLFLNNLHFPSRALFVPCEVFTISQFYRRLSIEIFCNERNAAFIDKCGGISKTEEEDILAAYMAFAISNGFIYKIPSRTNPPGYSYRKGKEVTPFKHPILSIVK